MDPTKKPGVNSRAREGQTVPASYKTLEVLLIYTVNNLRIQEYAIFPRTTKIGIHEYK